MRDDLDIWTVRLFFLLLIVLGVGQAVYKGLADQASKTPAVEEEAR